MTKSATPPDAENELSRRTARLGELTKRYGNPFNVTQFAKSDAAQGIKNKYANLPAGG